MRGTTMVEMLGMTRGIETRGIAMNTRGGTVIIVQGQQHVREFYYICNILMNYLSNAESGVPGWRLEML